MNIKIVQAVYNEVLSEKQKDVTKVWDKNERLRVRREEIYDKDSSTKWEGKPIRVCSQAHNSTTISKGKEAQSTKVLIPSVKKIPPYTTWVYTPRSIVVEDEKKELHTPYIDEATFDEDPSFLEKLEDLNDDKDYIDVGDQDVFYETVIRLNKLERQKKTAINVEHNWMMQEMEIVRRSPSSTLQTCEINSAMSHSEVKDMFTPSFSAFEALHKIVQGDSPKKLREKFRSLLTKRHPTVIKQNLPGVNNIDDDNSNNGTYNQKQCLDSFEKLFCRKCFLYSCPFHPKEEFVSPEFIQKIQTPRVQKHPCSPNCYLHKRSPDAKLKPKASTSAKCPEWNSNDISLFRAVLPVYPGNFCTVAKILGKNCRQVEQIAKKEAVLFTQHEDAESESANFRKGQKAKRKVAYNTIWKKNAASYEQFMKVVYKPCVHPGMDCNDAEDCSCIKSGTPCEKYCMCKKDCGHRLVGCECEGKCDTKQCPCFCMSRECDPDLCKSCKADSPDLSFIRCRNVGIQRQLRKHCLKVAESGIPNAGWGLFSVDNIAKGDFICEYTGEVITDEEADRRSLVYQKRCHTFVFELNSDYSIDAVRKGNKMRFANHADKPNMKVKTMKVNTDQRIGIYAARDITVGEELFIDYSKVIEEHNKIKQSKGKAGRGQRPPAKSASSSKIEQKNLRLL